MQETGDNSSYVIAGTGVAGFDGVEEVLEPGVMHICSQGSTYSIRNTGGEDLVLVTIVVKHWNPE